MSQQMAPVVAPFLLSCFLLFLSVSVLLGSSCSAAGDLPKLLRVALIGAGACRVSFLPDLSQLLTLLASCRLSLFPVMRLSAVRVHSPQPLPELPQDLTTLAAVFPFVVIPEALPLPLASSSRRSLLRPFLFCGLSVFSRFGYSPFPFTANSALQLQV